MVEHPKSKSTELKTVSQMGHTVVRPIVIIEARVKNVEFRDSTIHEA